MLTGRNCWCVAARGCQDRNAGEEHKEREEAIVAFARNIYF